MQTYHLRKTIKKINAWHYVLSQPNVVTLSYDQSGLNFTIQD